MTVLYRGRSGAGYAHINHWDAENLAVIHGLPLPYLKRGGLRVITIWDRVAKSGWPVICNELSKSAGVGQIKVELAYQLNLGLRTIGLTPTYTSTVAEMVEGITKAAAD